MRDKDRGRGLDKKKGGGMKRVDGWGVTVRRESGGRGVRNNIIRQYLCEGGGVH